MQLLLVLVTLISFNALAVVQSETVDNEAGQIKGDLQTAGTFGIGHRFGHGYRRRHFGYGGYNNLGWLGGGYDPYRPTFGKIIITYPKYIGHEHGHGHGGYGHGHGGYGKGFGGYGGYGEHRGLGYGHGWGGFKKGGFRPSRYLGPIFGHGHGYGHGHYSGIGYR